MYNSGLYAPGAADIESEFMSMPGEGRSLMSKMRKGLSRRLGRNRGGPGIEGVSMRCIPELPAAPIPFMQTYNTNRNIVRDPLSVALANPQRYSQPVFQKYRDIQSALGRTDVGRREAEMLAANEGMPLSAMQQLPLACDAAEAGFRYIPPQRRAELGIPGYDVTPPNAPFINRAGPGSGGRGASMGSPRLAERANRSAPRRLLRGPIPDRSGRYATQNEDADEAERMEYRRIIDNLRAFQGSRRKVAKDVLNIAIGEDSFNLSRDSITDLLD